MDDHQEHFFSVRYNSQVQTFSLNCPLASTRNLLWPEIESSSLKQLYFRFYQACRIFFSNECHYNNNNKMNAWIYYKLNQPVNQVKSIFVKWQFVDWKKKKLPHWIDFILSCSIIMKVKWETLVHSLKYAVIFLTNNKV